MSGLGKKLFHILGDSEITANFQYLCGIRRLVDSKCVAVNGNSVTGYGNAGVRKFVSDDSFTNNCNSSSKVNGHEEFLSVKETRQLCNGLAKEETAHFRNGYVHDVIPAGIHTDNIFAYETLVNHNGNGMEQKTRQEGQKCTTSALKYTVENPLLYYVFSFGANLGNEIFYILFFSSTLWNFDSFVIRKLLIMWCVIMYFGQATKDIIKWPRPKSPPVVRLEDRYELEYGMPSTHAMVGVAIPFGMIIFMSGRYEFNSLLGFTIACTWSLLVGLSRLYLGMHSVLDIIAGLVYAVCLMFVTASVVDPVDNFLMSHPAALPVTAAVCIALCLLYPSLERWSTARGDTTLVLGVVSGIYAGMWLTVKLTDMGHIPDSPPYILGLPSAWDVSLTFFRQTMGIVIIVLFLTCVKMTVLHTTCWFFNYDPKDPKTKQRLSVELPYRYVSYYISAVATTYLMPLLFLKFNIERQSYYSEIFNH